MLATTAIGAIWACCSPDFGERGTLDRLAQLSPKVLFAIDGYRYGGKSFDRRDELRRIASSLSSLQHLIYLPYLNPSDPSLPFPSSMTATRRIRPPMCCGRWRRRRASSLSARAPPTLTR